MSRGIGANFSYTHALCSLYQAVRARRLPHGGATSRRRRRQSVGKSRYRITLRRRQSSCIYRHLKARNVRVRGCVFVYIVCHCRSACAREIKLLFICMWAGGSGKWQVCVLCSFELAESGFVRGFAGLVFLCYPTSHPLYFPTAQTVTHCISRQP